MAVEDGAALAEAVNQVETDDQFEEALKVFQRVRILRTSQMQEASLINGKIWHFADGREQQTRDNAMLAEVQGRHFIESPNQFSDPVTQSWAYGYDAEVEMKQAMREHRAHSS
jgi:salicylate hydroxylase